MLFVITQMTLTFRSWLFLVMYLLAAVAPRGASAQAACATEVAQGPDSLVPLTGAALAGIPAPGWNDAASFAPSAPAGCMIQLDSGRLRPAGADSCAALFDVSDIPDDPWERSLTVTLAAAPALTCANAAPPPASLAVVRSVLPRVEGSYRFDTAGTGAPQLRVTLPEGSGLDQVLLRVGSMWKAYTKDNVEQGIVSADWSQIREAGARTLRGFGKNAAGAWSELVLAVATSLESCAEGAYGSTEEMVDLWCSDELFSRHQLLCFDATRGAVSAVKTTDASLARPNQGFAVMVRTCPATPVRMSLGGERGTLQRPLEDRRRSTAAAPPATKSEIAEARKAMRDGTATGTQQKLLAQTFPVTIRTFGPRKPGVTDLTLTVGQGSTPEEYELTVLEKELGALRIGLGAVLGKDAVPALYEAKIPAGSSTPIVTQTSGGRGAAELVLGAAPFVFDYLFWGGRSRENHDNALLAPFVGFGVLTADASGVDAFRSFHLGMEIELAREISLAFTWVYRRGPRLTGGLQDGSALMGTDIMTREDWGHGLGIVINATPDVFRFAVPSAGAKAEDKPEEDEQAEDGDDEEGSEAP